MNRDRGEYRVLALAGTTVTELVVPILCGVWVDNNYGTAPWGVLAGAVLGFVGGLGHLLVVANRVGNPGPGGPKSPPK
jgi:F0F1-type ATP synthase assembly protein I